MSELSRRVFLKGGTAAVDLTVAGGGITPLEWPADR